jgi:hypothetical protein
MGSATPTGDPVGSASLASGVPVRESCPLCGTPLHSTQEWCLSCGAAARTRLAATPRWRAPVITLCVVIVLALGALTAALVSLAG